MPNVQRSEPGEINRQPFQNSSSSPLELTQIGEISLWSCLLNNKQNTNLISLIPNRSKWQFFFTIAFLLCGIVLIKKESWMFYLCVFCVDESVYLSSNVAADFYLFVNRRQRVALARHSSVLQTTYIRKQNKEKLLASRSRFFRRRLRTCSASFGVCRPIWIETSSSSRIKKPVDLWHLSISVMCACVTYCEQDE